MYRKNSSGSGLTLFVILGILAGIGYVLLDARPTAPQPRSAAARPTTAPSATPLAQSLAALVTPEPLREITAGAMFFAPTAGIRTPIVSSYLNGTSWDVDDLGRNAGHLQGTAWITDPGNVVLAGHAEVFSGAGGVFSTLDTLNPGDPLIITQNGAQAVYNVIEAMYVQPDNLEPFYPSRSPRLTLTTCSDYDLLQNAYQQRYVVIAERVT